MKKASITFIIIFIISLIFVATSFIIVENKEFSENENRYLASKPKLTWSNIVTGKFSENFENYIDDQFIFREKLYEIKTRIQLLVGNKDINGVYISKDNYLIEKKLEQDFDYNIFSENIKSINEFANKNSNVKLMIVPTSSLILEDKLPENAVTFNQNKVFEEIKISIKNANFIDVRDTLKKHKDEYIYYKTDHHWTSLGSFYAYEQWCKQKNIDIPNYEKRCVTTEFKGSLYSKILNSNVETDYIELFETKNQSNYTVHYNFNKKTKKTIYDLDKLKEKDKYQMFLGGNFPELKIETDNTNCENILIIKDSYANSFIPFLVNHYKNIYVVDLRYFKDSLNTYIEKNDISEILILYNIENLLEDETIRFIKK